MDIFESTHYKIYWWLVNQGHECNFAYDQASKYIGE